MTRMAKATTTPATANDGAASAKRMPWGVPLALTLLVLGLSLVFVQDPTHDATLIRQYVQHHFSWLLSENHSPTVACDDALLHLTDVMPVKGFHVLCVHASPVADALQIVGYKDGMLPNRTAEAANEWPSFQWTVEELLEIAPPTEELASMYKQPYAFFTPEGERLDAANLTQIVDHRVVFLFEGGQFIWPGIRVGHKRVVKGVYENGNVVLETLSMTPLVFGVDNFLKDEEIDIILDLSMPHLKPSGVTHNDGDENRPATDWRTSTTFFLPSSAHQVVQDIDRRTADLVKVPMSHQEFVQVLRYEATQKYDHHLDYFSASQHQNSPRLLESIHYGYKNRMITVFWYMSDVAKGGHTIFPRAGGLPQPSSMRDCTTGLKVQPKKRKVIVFYSMLPNGQGDETSLHGGCPVEEGVKYSGNKWVWNKPRKDIT